MLKELYNSKCNPDNLTCYVKDVIGDQVKVVFILESPEKTEVREGIPAIGRAGKAMSRHLFDSHKLKIVAGIGSLIKSKNSIARKYGIINVCNYPLQYTEITEYIRKSISNNKNPLNRLNNIKAKSRIKKGIDDDECVSILIEIEGEFSNRILKLIEAKPNINLIPCGKFAQAFTDNLFKEKSIKKNEKVLYPYWAKKIPHPSYGGWSKKKNAKIINDMISIIK